MKIVVTIPTYNEAENIKSLILEILKVHPEIEVLVIDDDSPDGTWKKVEELSMENPKVHLLRRCDKKGRGTAGIDGFKYALKLSADFIVEMDADFSHHPKYIPDMLREIQNYDIVIGSKLIKGSLDARKSFVRKLITKFANFYIRTMLNINIQDCTSGYRMFRRVVFEKIGLDSIISSGPSIVQEILYKAYKCGFSIKEIPIIFEDRKKGKSTFNFKIILDSFFKILMIRLK